MLQGGTLHKIASYKIGKHTQAIQESVSLVLLYESHEARSFLNDKPC